MRVLAINDISCVGRCSLAATLPIVSACGVECNVLPTALLSTHTGGFTGYTFRDLTTDISDILKHWKTLGISFDFIYSGYLGSIEQIQLVKEIKKDFLANGGKFVVDPVMGDSGKLYDGFTAKYRIDTRDLSSFDSVDARAFAAQYKRYPFDEFDTPFCNLPPLKKHLKQFICEHISDI